jgi:hypothetical protein
MNRLMPEHSLSKFNSGQGLVHEKEKYVFRRWGGEYGRQSKIVAKQQIAALRVS